MTDADILQAIKDSHAEVLVTVKGKADEILQALGHTHVQILSAVEADRNQLDTLEQTIKPELRYLRETLNSIMAFFRKMGR